MLFLKRKVAIVAIGRYGCHSKVKFRFLNNLNKPLNADLFIITDDFTKEQVLELSETYKPYLKNIHQIKGDFNATYEEFYLTQFGPFKIWLKQYLDKQPNKEKEEMLKTIAFFNKLYENNKPQFFKESNLKKEIPNQKKEILKKILNEFSPYQGLCQWYKYYYGMRKIDEYQIKNKIEYDCILKIRLDQPPKEPISQAIFNGINENRIIANWDYNFYGNFETMKLLSNLLFFSKDNFQQIDKTTIDKVDLSLIDHCLKHFTKNQSGGKFNFYSENLLLYFLSFHKIKFNQSKLKFDLDFYKKNNPKINFLFKGDKNKIKDIKQKLNKTNFYTRVIFCSHSAREYTFFDLEQYFKNKINQKINIIQNGKKIDLNLKMKKCLNQSITLEIC